MHAETPKYDIVIVGGGPSGLSAARTTTRLGFRTLLIEQADGPDQLGRPCTGVVAPAPGFVTGRRRFGGFFFPQIDLLIPDQMLTEYSGTQRCISPGGYEVETKYYSRNGFPMAVIDKGALQRQLMTQAGRSGAEFKYKTRVIGLAEHNGSVVGVRTENETISARIVMSAEGANGTLAREAGLFGSQNGQGRHAFVVGATFDAPMVTQHDLGEVVTLGKNYTSAREGFGSVIITQSGRANAYFTLFADGPHHHTLQSAGYYLKEFVEEDPRVSALLHGATPISRTAFDFPIDQRAQNCVSDGFMAIGESLTPGSRLGIIPSIYVGRQAALMAAEALDSGDVTHEGLAAYEQFFRSLILPTLDNEYRAVSRLMRMSDNEIDRLTKNLRAMHASVSLFSESGSLGPQSASWIARQLPLVARDADMLERLLAGDNETEDSIEVLPLSLGSQFYMRQ